MWTAVTLESFLQPAVFLYCFHGCTSRSNSSFVTNWGISGSKPRPDMDQAVEPGHQQELEETDPTWCTSLMQEQSRVHNPEDHIRPRYCVLIYSGLLHLWHSVPSLTVPNLPVCPVYITLALTLSAFHCAVKITTIKISVYISILELII